MPAVMEGRAARIRAWSLAAAVLLIAALLLTSCPNIRDGASGQLSQAQQETESAARSGALALDLWATQRATDAATSVALTDARNEVVKAYETVNGVVADDSTDLARQHLLAGSMTEVVGILNTAVSTVRGTGSQPSPETLRGALTASADALADR
jgi:hypothetical protein